MTRSCPPAGTASPAATSIATMVPRIGARRAPSSGGGRRAGRPAPRACHAPARRAGLACDARAGERSRRDRFGHGRRDELSHVGVDVAGVHAIAVERGLSEEAAEEPEIRRNALDAELRERARRLRHRGRQRGRAHDHLRQQRVEARARPVPGVATRVDADSGPGRHLEGRERAARRPHSAVGRQRPMLTRASSATPRIGGGASGRRPTSASDRPAASASWIPTRSSPVTASVTVCSTCRRGFASRNAARPSGPTRNSNVPRPS